MATFLASLEAFSPATVTTYKTAKAEQHFPFGWIWLKETDRLAAGSEPTIEVQHADGQTEIRKIPLFDRKDVQWTSLQPAVALLRNADSKQNYSHRFIEDGRTLYLRYGYCQNQEGQASVWSFTGQVQQEAKNASVKRIIVDLRGNGGGNSLLFWRMARWIRKNPAFSRPNGTLVLTDSGTFSSGFMAAMELQRAGAKLIGGGPGQPMNAYGDIRFTKLGDLRPVFGCSTKTFINEPGDPTAWHRSLKVNVPMDETREDVLGMTDSVLTAALNTPFP